MKFLIIKLSSLGDIIHSLPMVNILRHNYPDSRIDLLTGKKGIALLKLIKEIDCVYINDFHSLSEIRKNKYDYVYDAQGLFKTGLLSLISCGKCNVGFRNTREFADLFYKEKINVGNLFKTDKHIVDLNIKLLFNCPDKYDKIRFLIPNIKKPENPELENISYNHKNVLVLPATTWMSKMWPLKYWNQLIKELVDSGYNVFLTASRSDKKNIQPLIDELNMSNVRFSNFLGKIDISDFIFLTQRMNTVIGLDSGGLHLACAIGNDFSLPKVVGIYGPTSVQRNGPYGNPQNAIYCNDLPCLTCRKKICPLLHHNCMNNITPDIILDKIIKL